MINLLWRAITKCTFILKYVPEINAVSTEESFKPQFSLHQWRDEVKMKRVLYRSDFAKLALTLPDIKLS